MTSNQEWQQCPPGELVRFAGREKSRTLRRRVLSIGGIAVSLIAIGALFVGRQSVNSAEPNYGGIRCSAVREKAKAHLAGEIDAGTEAKIVLHLKMCPLCQSYLKKLASQQANYRKERFSFERFVSVHTATHGSPSCTCRLYIQPVLKTSESSQ